MSLPPRLSVRVDAHFSWATPPESIQEEVLRSQANVLAAKAAHKITQAVELLILEMLSDDMRQP